MTSRSLDDLATTFDNDHDLVAERGWELVDDVVDSESFYPRDGHVARAATALLKRLAEYGQPRELIVFSCEKLQHLLSLTGSAEATSNDDDVLILSSSAAFVQYSRVLCSALRRVETARPTHFIVSAQNALVPGSTQLFRDLKMLEKQPNPEFRDDASSILSDLESTYMDALSAFIDFANRHGLADVEQRRCMRLATNFACGMTNVGFGVDERLVPVIRRSLPVVKACTAGLSDESKRFLDMCADHLSFQDLEPHPNALCGGGEDNVAPFEDTASIAAPSSLLFCLAIATSLTGPKQILPKMLSMRRLLEKAAAHLNSIFQGELGTDLHILEIGCLCLQFLAERIDPRSIPISSLDTFFPLFDSAGTLMATSTSEALRERLFLLTASAVRLFSDDAQFAILTTMLMQSPFINVRAGGVTLLKDVIDTELKRDDDGDGVPSIFLTPIARERLLDPVFDPSSDVYKSADRGSLAGLRDLTAVSEFLTVLLNAVNFLFYIVSKFKTGALCNGLVDDYFLQTVRARFVVPMMNIQTTDVESSETRFRMEVLRFTAESVDEQLRTLLGSS